MIQQLDPASNPDEFDRALGAAKKIRAFAQAVEKIVGYKLGFHIGCDNLSSGIDLLFYNEGGEFWNPRTFLVEGARVDENGKFVPASSLATVHDIQLNELDALLAQWLADEQERRAAMPRRRRPGVMQIDAGDLFFVPKWRQMLRPVASLVGLAASIVAATIVLIVYLSQGESDPFWGILGLFWTLCVSLTIGIDMIEGFLNEIKEISRQ